MLLVKTKIGPSKLHGIGCFADEFIPKGTIMWKFVPGFDLVFNREDIEKLPNIAQNFIKTYSYLSLDTGRYILCSDDSWFYNHSDDPNTMGIDLKGTEDEGADIAIRDIEVGEEITFNYKDPKQGVGNWWEHLSQ